MSYNYNSKMAWWKIALIALAVILIVGALAGLITSLVINRDDAQEGQLSTKAYSVGGLNEDGTYLDTRGSIYTKDLFKCADLKCSLVFDHNISYRVFFYDGNENFMSSTTALAGNYSDVPYGASYCRIVITPDSDQNIKWYEVKGYAKQLTVEYNSNAKITPIKNVLNYECEDGTDFYYDYETPQTQSGSQYKASKPIAVEEYTKIVISTKVKCYILYGDKDGHKCTSYRMVSVGQNDTYVEGQNTFADFNTYTFDIPEGAAYFRVVCSQSAYSYGYISGLYLTK